MELTSEQLNLVTQVVIGIKEQKKINITDDKENGYKHVEVLRKLLHVRKPKIISKLKQEECGIEKLRKYRLSISGTLFNHLYSSSPSTLPLPPLSLPPLSLPPLASSSTSCVERVRIPIRCYICKKKYHDLHHFYSQLCRDCGDFNYLKRLQSIGLKGYEIILVTGGRIKIGYHIALKLLRDNSKLVIVTTRFPEDCQKRYALENDYDVWKHKLKIYGINFCNLNNVEMLCEHLLKELPYLSILINNAAQTIEREPSFYKHLEPNKTSKKSLTSSKDIISFDIDLQPIDERKQNSWTSKIDDISTTELINVLSINSATPFILISKLKKLMNHSKSFIINVSSMESSFIKRKTSNHPHTNAAKNVFTKKKNYEFLT